MDREEGVISGRDKEIVFALAMRIMANSVEAMGMLDKLYSKLRIGGGLLRGRKIPEETAKKTRHELIAYITALTRILLETWQNPTVDIKRISRALELTVFSLELSTTRPVYEDYIARFHNQRQEAGVHGQFIKNLLMLWTFYPVPGSSDYSECTTTVIAVGKMVEHDLQDARDSIRP